MGSSPLTRGKRQVREMCITCQGIIPAHAGKTQVAGSLASGRGDHPRSRGENGLPGFVDADDGGSSPLTRGKQDQGIVRGVGAGIIPAHAGKTRRVAGLAARAGDHPRSRGENLAQGRDRA